MLNQEPNPAPGDPEPVTADLPPGETFTDADAAALGKRLSARRSSLPISEGELPDADELVARATTRTARSSDALAGEIFAEANANAAKRVPVVHETRGLLCGSYSRGWSEVYLTHTVRVEGETETPLCRVKPESICDRAGHSPEELAAEPTCKTCRRRDPRFKGLPAEGDQT